MQGLTLMHVYLEHKKGGGLTIFFTISEFGIPYLANFVRQNSESRVLQNLRVVYPDEGDLISMMCMARQVHNSYILIFLLEIQSCLALK